MGPLTDAHWMAAAIALGERGRGLSAPNPNVGCVIVRGDRVVGRGWTQPGGRPHAEAMALAQAGEGARGAAVYTSLEPCAHRSQRGPACAPSLVEAGVSRVIAALRDPDQRTDGQGHALLEAAGIEVVIGIGADAARRAMAGFLTRQALGRPHVTLKLGLSLDGAIAMADGSSRWITGPQARAHAHVERAKSDAILVGRGTAEADVPTLDVRLPGMEDRSPRRVLLSATNRHPSGSWDLPVASSRTPAARDPSFRWGDDGEWTAIASPSAIATLEGVDWLLVEGGMGAAASFLAADLVDRLLLYRAPLLIGGGRTLGDIGLTDLAYAHGRWTLADARQLGSDRLEVYERVRQ